MKTDYEAITIVNHAFHTRTHRCSRGIYYALRILSICLLCAVAIIKPSYAQDDSIVYLPLVTRAEPPYALTCNPSAGSGGLSPGIHEVTVAGANAVVVVGDDYDPTQPTYLAYYIHSQSENEYKVFKNGANKVTQAVKDRGWIFVAPEAPDGITWGANERSTADVDLFKAILDEMVNSYNVCRDIILGSGASNGSYFWDTRLFPEIGHEYPAFMIMNCGAGLWSYWQEVYGSGDRIRGLAQANEILQRTQIKYVYGTEDFLIHNIKASIDFFKEVGIDVIVDQREGVDHCDFDVYDETRSYWRAVADELGDPS